MAAPLDITATARAIRRSIIEMAHRARCPHVGSALSCVDILATLYCEVMRIPHPASDQRDIFLLSKAHAAMALYATLHHRGFLDRSTLDGYYANGGTLPAHTDRQTAPGIEISAGSLGHGLPMGLGMAHALKLQQQQRRRVFVLLGDGEIQEGSIWEAAMLAPRLGLDNLCAIVDYNDLQGYGRPSKLVAFEPLEEKWRSFGWQVERVDGHDHDRLRKAFQRPVGKPKVVLCRTVKGKGVSFMEDQLIWHYYIVTDEHRRCALEELS